MAADRMFGLETEYAFSALGPNGEALDRATWVTRFMDLAYRRLRNLPDKHGGGVFLETGGRFYRDAGNHPELTTPEVVNPWDLCRYVSAGDRALRRVADELMAAGGGLREVVLSRSNVSYGTYQSTWACHESYSHRAALDVLPRHLIPHLVTRVIYTGAGGFNNRTPGIEFTLSPRVAHIQSVSSDSSQSARGIYHTKNEQLNDQGYNRLHILVGESVCSERSNFLKVATTALVVAMIEANLNPGDGLWPADPVGAIRGICGDVSLTSRFRCADGRERTAIDVQRQYLELASRNAQASFMPSWTTGACVLWRHELDLLTQGADAVARRLDWAIKLKIFRQAAARAGIDWDKLPVWSKVLVTLTQKAIELQIGPEGRRMDFRLLNAGMVGPGQPLAPAAEQLTPLLRENGLNWSQFGNLLTLRQQLFELDTRFSEVSNRGVFAAMDAARALEHHVDGVDNIDHAVCNPPEKGRAKLRGDCVKRFGDRRTEYSASWMGVWDESKQKFLNLSDPFRETESWTDLPVRPATVPTPGVAERMRQSAYVLTRITELYGQGDYGQAEQFGDFFRTNYPHIEQHERASILRMLAFTRSRRGDASTFDTLAQSQGAVPQEMPGLVDQMCLFRFYGLVPDERISVSIERCLLLMAQNPTRHGRSIAAFHDHYAWRLLCQDRLDEAREILDPYRTLTTHADACARVLARIHSTLSEVDRRQGRFDAAHDQAQKTREIQTRGNHKGDLAEFAMMAEARLELDYGRRMEKLRTALTQQRLFKHTMGEARTLLLMARIGLENTELATVRTRLGDLQRTVPALTNCPKLRKVLDHWTQWTTTAPLPGAAEYFAGV